MYLNYMRYILITLSILTLFLPFGSASAESLKDKISNLNVIDVNYGVNNIVINNNNVIISKSKFLGETVEMDGYTIQVQKDDFWQFIRFQNKKGLDNDVITWADNKENKVISKLFLKAQKTSKDLFMLEAKRLLKNDSLAATAVLFSLYKMQKDNDFGIIYLKKISELKSIKKYLNSDEAISKEFLLNGSRL